MKSGLAEGQAYLFILTDSLNNVLATYDNIYGIHDFVAGNPGVTFGGTVTFNGPVQVHTTSFQFTGGSNRIQGDFSNAVIVNRVIFQTSTANGATDLVAMPNGASPAASLNIFNGTDPANAGFGHFGISGGECSLQSSRTGAGTVMPLTFYCGILGAAEAMRVSTTNNQLLIATTTESTVTGAKLRVNGIAQIDNSCTIAVNRNGVNQAGIANNVFTKVQLTTKRIDQNNNFDNAVNYRWTPPAGTYAIFGNSQFAGLTAAGRTATIIYKNGAALFSNNVSGTIGAPSGSTVGGFDTANGTDYYELFCWHLTGGVEQISGLTQDTQLTGIKIG
jgi:hypothetical protein